MVNSDWGDWLVREIEDADPAGVALWYLGCNGFALAGGDTTLFIDPYLGTGDPPRSVPMITFPFDPEDIATVDAVFATREHTDHVHGPSQAPILDATGATVSAREDSLAVADEEGWADEYELEADRFAETSAGD